MSRWVIEVDLDETDEAEVLAWAVKITGSRSVYVYEMEEED